MPNCLIFYHNQIVNLHLYLQIIFIIYFTENLAVLPIDYCFIGLRWSIFKSLCIFNNDDLFFFFFFFFFRFLRIKLPFDHFLY